MEKIANELADMINAGMTTSEIENEMAKRAIADKDWLDFRSAYLCWGADDPEWLEKYVEEKGTKPLRR